MSVAIIDCRAECGDMPRTFPLSAEPPDTIGIGDGVTTVFFLKYPNFVASSLALYTATPPSSGPATVAYVGVASSAYTVSGTQITFLVAPAVGVIIGSRCQATAFSDAQLQIYLTGALSLQSDDRTVKLQFHYDIIPAILANQDAMILIKQGDFTRDPSKWVASWIALRSAIGADLTGAPRAGSSIPVMMVGGTDLRRYEVRE